MALTPEQRERFREMGRRGGATKEANRKAAAALAAPAPFAGTMLDMMDAAVLTGDTWEVWRTFWRAVFALPMTATDLERLTRHTGRATPPAVPVREAWLAVGRRGGKSRMAALAALYQGIRRDYVQVLAPGETATVAVIAADRAQARATLGYNDPPLRQAAGPRRERRRAGSGAATGEDGMSPTVCPTVRYREDAVGSVSCCGVASGP